MNGTWATVDSNERDELDQPPYDGQRKYYIICSTPRTGSSLLCDLLTHAGVGVPMEYFHRRNHVPKLLSRYRLLGLNSVTVTMEDYVEALKRNRTTPNGYFGFKVHRGQFKWLVDHCDVGRSFPGLKYIYLFRRDTLAQAVSESKAVQSRQWNSAQSRVAEPEYNEAHIDFCLHTIRKANRYWHDFFESRSIKPLRIEYEELVTDLKPEFRRVLGYLAATDASVAEAVQATTLRKQSDSINRQWIERYRDAHGID